MKLAFAAVGLALATSSASLASSITYAVSETAGTQTATGTITTNGTTGVLNQSDITAFAFNISNGTTSNMVTSTNGGTFIVVDNDFTASSADLFFNFASTTLGSGFALYDANALNVLCVATKGSCYGTYPDNIVIALNGNYTEVNTAATNQIVGTAVTTAATPEPGSFLLLGTGALGLLGAARRRFA